MQRRNIDTYDRFYVSNKGLFHNCRILRLIQILTLHVIKGRAREVSAMPMVTELSHPGLKSIALLFISS